MPKRQVERWYYYCEPCGYKKIVEGAKHGLVEIKTSPIPLGAPKKPTKHAKEDIKEEPKQDASPKSKPQNTKVKCPKCGRGITAKQLVAAFQNAYEEAEKRDKTQRELEDKKNRLLDGLPKKRRTEFEKEFDKMVGKYLPDKKTSQHNLNEFEKVIDSLMEGRKKNEQSRKEKEGHHP
jgi:predicted transcriptional regulator